MSDRDLHDLAEAVGIETGWRDVHGQWHAVTAESLRAVLHALDLPAASPEQIVESRKAADALADLANRPLVTAVAGQPLDIPGTPGRFRLSLEDGSTLEGTADAAGLGVRLPPIAQPGYHRVELAGRETRVAVAPPRCWRIADAAAGRKLWGLAAQLYSLRRHGDGGIGDFEALEQLVRSAAARGAAAVAVSPVHAQFSADPDRFSPYAPSSRVALNVLHASPGPVDGAVAAELARLEALDLADWPAAGRARLQVFRAAYDRFRASGSNEEQAALARFRAGAGEALELHAVFEALHEIQFRQHGRWHWKDWPAELRDPTGPAVQAFARDHAEDVAWHAYLQHLADRGLEAAQQAARAAGMSIGLIADLAVGTDGGGSHAWSRQFETLTGLTVGAPPDLLNTRGQNWGVTAFSPRGLIANGFTAFLEMLRAALRHAGGVRIDHVMGLARLWVVPEGASAADGAYLRFPLDDMLRLVALESTRHRAVILGEDLGTLPDGFRERLEGAALSGMRVMWFERSEQQFHAPAWWSRDAVAMTTTHDLPTVSGWWQARELDWSDKLGFPQPAARAARVQERSMLWDAFRQSGATDAPQPADWDGTKAANAAAFHVGTASCDLALLPLEDALALPEQPNLPGTTTEHPNWRRRMPAPAATLLDDPDVAARLDALIRGREKA